MFSILSHYCSRNAIYRERVRKGKINCSLEILTRSLSCLTELYNIFYVDKVKVIPEDVYNLLSPVVLAPFDYGRWNKGSWFWIDPLY